MSTNASLSKNALTYGVIAGIVLIIYSVILYILDLTFFKPVLLGQVVGTVFVVVMMLIGTKNLRDKMMHGSISYGKAFLSAFLIGFIAFVISLLFSNLMSYVIDPGLQQKAIDYTIEKYSSSGRFSEEQIDLMIEQQKTMGSKPGLIILGQAFALIFMAIISAVAALITAAIQKKDDNSFESAMTGTEEQK
jgi:hypothetical protein